MLEKVPPQASEKNLLSTGMAFPVADLACVFLALSSVVLPFSFPWEFARCLGRGKTRKSASQQWGVLICSALQKTEVVLASNLLIDAVVIVGKRWGLEGNKPIRFWNCFSPWFKGDAFIFSCIYRLWVDVKRALLNKKLENNPNSAPASLGPETYFTSVRAHWTIDDLAPWWMWNPVYANTAE